jgi:hypothetical protein
VRGDHLGSSLISIHSRAEERTPVLTPQGRKGSRGNGRLSLRRASPLDGDSEDGSSAFEDDGAVETSDDEVVVLR